MERLKADPEEDEYFINALTTNLTSFFRESHHFDVLKDYIAKNRRPLVIWCAACSTGEEAYSIAITCAEARGSSQHNIKILASDIDSKVLITAKDAVYPMKAVEKLNIQQKKRYFLKGKGKRHGSVKVVQEIKNNVKFFQQNLLENSWQIESNVDVIFCRNVMIYFDRSTQEKLIKRFVKIMNPEALYVAGHSENFNHMQQHLAPIGKTVYVKSERSGRA